MNIVLTGFMGTGKTAVGRRLAKRLGWRFVDLDALIEAGARCSIARIFAERGEAVFRRFERRTVARVVRERHQVIATGGGTFVDPRNQTRLRVSGPVVCLTAKPQIILNRLGRRCSERPLLAGSPRPLARVRELLAQRAGAYAKADVTIDTTHLALDDVVERILDALGSCLCSGWRYVQEHTDALAKRYSGQYIVVSDGRIVSSGQTQLEAYQNAAQRLPRQQEAGIYYIPLPEESLTAL